jgi:dCMP deaminase
MIPPRDVPCRDDFYMGMALWYMAKSKDPKTQNGALVISEDNTPMGWGYNGPPKQIDDDDIDWCRKGDITKYDLVDHAEDNAIEYSCDNLEGATIYVSGRPCPPCMRKIVRAGIKRVVWFNRKVDKGSTLADQAKVKKTEYIARKGNVKLEMFAGDLSWMEKHYEFLRQIGAVA